MIADNKARSNGSKDFNSKSYLAGLHNMSRYIRKEVMTSGDGVITGVNVERCRSPP